ncbi:MAG: NAD(P)-dependent alcohol dehydrogenase [Calditrichaeota bacterium]|nr:MAG: NAD(P)-dependent alcohol dehydrogenase [Calditrichota bacterium]MBL1203927.1 NAD(P)-dependent alcohol dehydrogenase [Calditrichota bacterium]NOG43760.1 NAD(P)-dependent alcohol dehydrogenase [Calditrichota bacterium]
MKAFVCSKFGSTDFLQLREVEKPIPKDKEVLVKIKATTVTIGDTIIRNGKHPDSKFYTVMLHVAFGFRKLRKSILGMELAGVVESIGKDVTRFKPGDHVFGSTFSIGFAAHAEYKCFPENGMLVLKPDNITFDKAATIPGGGMTALGVLRKANLKNGSTNQSDKLKVLINGASGAVGSSAVQLAKYFGAEVTGVCSGANLELVKSLGADKVIDYTKVDFTENGEKYDVVFDAVHKLDSSKAKKSLKDSGKYFDVLKDTSDKEKVEDLIFLKELIEAGKLKAVIDRHFPFDQIPEAHTYVEKGHKKGNVVIDVV